MVDFEEKNGQKLRLWNVKMAQKWSILKRGTGREFLSAIFDRQKQRGGAVLLASKNGASKKGPFYIYHVILGREKIFFDT